MTLRFFKSLFIFLVIMYSICYIVFIKVDKSFQEDNIICDPINLVQSTRNQTYDFAVTGSSRALNNLNNKVIDDSLKCRSINMASGGAGYAENFITLYHFLKNGNKINHLLLQVDGYNLNNRIAFHRAFNEQYYVHLLNDDTISEVIKNHVNLVKYYCWKLIPITRYMEYNFRFSMYKALKGGYSCGSVNDLYNGFVPLPKIKNNILRKSDSLLFTISDAETVYLRKIIDFCKAKNINLVLFTSPEYIDCIDRQKNKREIDSYYSNIAKKNKLVFISNTSFNEINRNALYFKDNTHLNYVGARCFALDLIQFISPLFNK